MAQVAVWTDPYSQRNAVRLVRASEASAMLLGAAAHCFRGRVLSKGVRQWKDSTERACLRVSARLRGSIRALERALVSWRTWAAALRQWKRWAEALDTQQRHRLSEVGLGTITEVRRPNRQVNSQVAASWRRGAMLRWDVASSGFAEELQVEAAKVRADLDHLHVRMHESRRVTLMH